MHQTQRGSTACHAGFIDDDEDELTGGRSRKPYREVAAATSISSASTRPNGACAYRFVQIRSDEIKTFGLFLQNKTAEPEDEQQGAVQEATA